MEIEPNLPQTKRVLADPHAPSVDPRLPAFLSRPAGAAVYHGFPLVAQTLTDGWCFGTISAFGDEREASEWGDGFVQAPDGSRAGLVWEVGDFATYEICAPSAGRWGVYGVAFSRAIRDVSDLVECFRSVLPDLQRIHRRVLGASD